MSVDASANKRPINPYIYGVNLATNQALIDLNPALNRQGGNNTSCYNWKLNANNRAFDWYFESIGEPSALEGERGDTFFTNSRDSGAPTITLTALPRRPIFAAFVAARGLDMANRWLTPGANTPTY